MFDEGFELDRRLRKGQFFEEGGHREGPDEPILTNGYVVQRKTSQWVFYCNGIQHVGYE